MRRELTSRRFLVQAGVGLAVLLAATVVASQLGMFPSAKEVITQNRIFDQPYRLAMGIVGVVLAVYLGVWSGLVGLGAGKVWLGLVALGAGGAVAILATAAMPWFVYPNDQYPVGFMWLLGGAPISLFAWLLVTFASRRSNEFNAVIA